MGNTTKMTAAGSKLLAKLPEMFRLVEDGPGLSPPTKVVDLDGRTVYTFGQGDSAAFKGLVRHNILNAGQIDGVWWYGR